MRNRCHWFQVQSEARIKLSPMDVEYDHLYWPSDHQLFIFREKLWIFLSVLEVGNLSLFTTFKKQFGLGRWKRGPPRIEHSIHSNFPPLNISLLDSSLFLTIYNDSYSFITTYVYRYINIYLKTLCLMLCMEFCLFDLHEGKRCGKSMTLEP